MAHTLPHRSDPLLFVDVPARVHIDGIFGVYELNRIALLRDGFVWAHERSCARYSAVRQSLGEPDPLRLQHRQQIAEVLAAVVRGGMDKKAATAFIRQRAVEKISPESRARFVEVVETELMSLHDGNVARYRLRPSEFESWRKSWRRSWR